MATEGLHHAEHGIAVSAPARAVYELIADVAAWSHLFPPTIHAERTSGDDTDERIRIWALAGDEVKTWTSHRQLDPAAQRIRFRQEVSHQPVTSMAGEWWMRPGADGGTDVVLTHEFSVTGDTPDNVAYIAQTIDRNSTAELAAVKSAAERYVDLPELVVSFADAVDIRGGQADVYDFLYRCQDWPKRLPHVARLDLREEVPGLQVMEMDTRTRDGDVHTTRSVRVCFPPDRIVYRQIAVPPLMAAHTGRWLIAPTADGVRATAEHTVVVKPESVPALLGPQATVTEARRRIRETLGHNSMTTLREVKAHVENGRP